MECRTLVVRKTDEEGKAAERKAGRETWGAKKEGGE